MESKGRRALRASAPGTVKSETVKPTATSPGSEKQVEVAAEEFIPAKLPVEVMAVARMPAPPIRDMLPTAAKNASGEEVADFGREVFAALVQSQSAVARGLEALSVELTGLAISGIDAATRTAKNMLGVKTLSDAIEVNAGFTRSSFDALVGGSAKLSELGMKLATEASQPILTQLGKSWIKAASRTS
jgi:hypothetical protein